MCGFDVRAVMPGSDREVIFEKIHAALALIEARDLRRCSYLRRDLPRISIVGLPSSIGQCHYSIGMCVLDYDYITSDNTGVVQVAQVLIHEGAHARLRRAGFTYDEGRRPRIERICIREEAAFARRVPGAEELAHEAESELTRPDSAYSDEARRRRDLAALKELGWLGKVGCLIGKICFRERR